MARHSHRASLRSQTGDRLKSISENEAWNLVWNGLAKPLKDRQGDISKPLQIQLLWDPERSARPSCSEADKAAITAKEMRIHALARAQRQAGLAIDPDELGRVLEVEEKIACYTGVGDSLAVRVGRLPSPQDAAIMARLG